MGFTVAGCVDHRMPAVVVVLVNGGGAGRGAGVVEMYWKS